MWQGPVRRRALLGSLALATASGCSAYLGDGETQEQNGETEPPVTSDVINTPSSYVSRYEMTVDMPDESDHSDEFTESRLVVDESAVDGWVNDNGAETDVTRINNTTYIIEEDGTCTDSSERSIQPDLVDEMIVELPGSSNTGEEAPFEYVGTQTLDGTSVYHWRRDFDEVAEVAYVTGESSVYASVDTGYVVKVTARYQQHGPRGQVISYSFELTRSQFDQSFDIQVPPEC
ncbi:MAG: hypothetical protein U5K37_09890 [Natrialbaceae archaeon]|nr:hypothetical protein [Natrialbaceae archaeon]